MRKCMRVADFLREIQPRACADWFSSQNYRPLCLPSSIESSLLTLLYHKNKRGPKIDPWGTPHVICCNSDLKSSIITYSWKVFFLLKQEQIKRAGCSLGTKSVLVISLFIIIIDLMHWRHVSTTTTPCWGSRLVALRAHVVLAERISPSVSALPGPARPARRYDMQGLACWLHAWRWPTWQCFVWPPTHVGPLLWRHMHMVYYLHVKYVEISKGYTQLNGRYYRTMVLSHYWDHSTCFSPFLVTNNVQLIFMRESECDASPVVMLLFLMNF